MSGLTQCQGVILQNRKKDFEVVSTIVQDISCLCSLQRGTPILCAKPRLRPLRSAALVYYSDCGFPYSRSDLLPRGGEASVLSSQTHTPLPDARFCWLLTDVHDLPCP